MTSRPIPGSGAGPRNRSERGPWIAVAVTFGFGLVSIVGFGVFALNPQNIPSTGIGPRIFAIAYPFFGQAQIAVAGLALLYILTRAVGARWLPSLLVVYLISFLAEYTGTRWGIPFGGYEYTALLGPKLAGRVPYWIPLSWFLMAVPSFFIAHSAFPRRESRIARWALATALLVTWDLALDPAMSHLTPYWLWEASGAYYGMPAVNLLGWAFTGAILMVALESLGARSWAEKLLPHRMIAYYAAMLFVPLGMSAVGGLWWAVLATLCAAIPLLHFALRRAGPGTGPGSIPLTPAPFGRTP